MTFFDGCSLKNINEWFMQGLSHHLFFQKLIFLPFLSWNKIAVQNQSWIPIIPYQHPEVLVVFLCLPKHDPYSDSISLSRFCIPYSPMFYEFFTTICLVVLRSSLQRHIPQGAFPVCSYTSAPNLPGGTCFRPVLTHSIKLSPDSVHFLSNPYWYPEIGYVV